MRRRLCAILCAALAAAALLYAAPQINPTYGRETACTIAEHTHTDECLAYACGLEEHIHTPEYCIIQQQVVPGGEETSIAEVQPAELETTQPAGTVSPPWLAPANIEAATAPTPSANPNDYYQRVWLMSSSVDQYDYITVNGKPAFCIDNGMNAPPDNSYPASIQLDMSGVDNPEMLLKILYYGYGGPGSSEAVNGTNTSAKPPNTTLEKKYGGSDFNAHRAFHGSYKSGYSNWGASDIWTDIAIRPIPVFDLKFVTAGGSVTLVDPGDGAVVQRSPLITLTGGPAGNSVNVPVSAPFTLRRSNGEAVAAGNTVNIKIGEAFYIEAPKEYTGTFAPQGMQGELDSIFVPVILIPQNQNKHQRVVVLAGFKADVTLEVDFAYEASEAFIHFMGTKSVYGANIPAGTLFRFRITQVANAAGDPFDGTPINRTINLTTDSENPKDYELAFPRVGKLTEGVYYFRVSETVGGGEGWVNHTEPWILTLTVAGDPLTAAFEGTIHFENTYAPGGPKLPETGGSGWKWQTTAGAAALLAGLAGLSAVLLINRAKRKLTSH